MIPYLPNALAESATPLDRVTVGLTDRVLFRSGRLHRGGNAMTVGCWINLGFAAVSLLSSTVLGGEVEAAVLASSSIESSSAKGEHQELVDDHSRFEQYNKAHGKVHMHAREAARRFEQFTKTSRFIQEFNTKAASTTSPTFHLRHNQFSDMSREEIGAMFAVPSSDSGSWMHDLGLDASMSRAFLSGLHDMGGAPNLNPDGVDPPVAVDWRSSKNPLGHGIVSPPQNQGHCGACWAMVAASVVESAVALSTGLMTQLSAQQLIDCDINWNAGCMGGNPIQAYDYIAQQGLTGAEAYPYEATKGQCRPAIPVSAIKSYHLLRSHDEDMLQRVVAQQPVAVGIQGQHPTFLFYGGGVFDDLECGSDLNHALVIVGYGRDEATGHDYWIAKNSWGTGWGENGYIRLARQPPSSKGPGVCGLAVAPSIPVGAFGGNTSALRSALEQEERRERLNQRFSPGVIGGSLGMALVMLLAWGIFISRRRYRHSASGGADTGTQMTGRGTPEVNIQYPSGFSPVVLHPTYYQCEAASPDDSEHHPFRTGRDFASMSKTVPRQFPGVVYSMGMPQQEVEREPLARGRAHQNSSTITYGTADGRS